MVIQSKITEFDHQFEASASSIMSDGMYSALSSLSINPLPIADHHRGYVPCCSFYSDMNAMERALHLNTLRDEITVSIASKIKDDKDKMLVLLLYKVWCPLLFSNMMPIAIANIQYVPWTSTKRSH